MRGRAAELPRELLRSLGEALLRGVGRGARQPCHRRVGQASRAGLDGGALARRQVVDRADQALEARHESVQGSQLFPRGRAARVLAAPAGGFLLGPVEGEARAAARAAPADAADPAPQGADQPGALEAGRGAAALATRAEQVNDDALQDVARVLAAPRQEAARQAQEQRFLVDKDLEAGIEARSAPRRGLLGSGRRVRAGNIERVHRWPLCGVPPTRRPSGRRTAEGFQGSAEAKADRTRRRRLTRPRRAGGLSIQPP